MVFLVEFLSFLLFVLVGRYDINLFNSRDGIAAIIGDIMVFYNSKNLYCLGALSFLRSVHPFSFFLK